MNKTTTPKTLIPLMMMIAGCNENERVTQIATEAADRQAQQNQEMVKLNREVAQGTKRLVEADAEARRDMAVLHQELQGERSQLNQQWNALETERKEIASDRRTESMLIPVAQALGLSLIAALVLGFCWSLVYGLQRIDDSDAQLADLLIHDILSERPAVLPAGSARLAMSDNHEPASSDTPLLPNSSTDT